MRRLSDLTRALRLEGPARNAAARELSAYLHGSLAPRLLAGFRLQQDTVSELVQQVIVHMFERPDLFRDKDWGYAARALQRRALNHLRSARSAHGGHAALEAEDAPELAAPTAHDPVEAEQRWRLMELALTWAVEQRKREIDRAPLRESWAQIKAVAEGRFVLLDVVLQTLPPGSAPDEIKKETSRLHKAHERCRTELLEAIHALFAQGRLTEEDRDLALRQHRGLFRAKPGPRANRHD